MEPQGSLQNSQVPATCPYSEQAAGRIRVSVQVRGFQYICFVTRYVFKVRSC